ncbi:glycerophosphoinositol permease [Halocaridina rubra]|uniref:Glycerophosphoinositol permease n=1 Tax=Halocaridina rubra TaxID=373956 RepID=A0AAN8ZXE1_HALRR
MSRVGGGARNKPRTSQDVCADCGAPDPGWASINRGILICDECCSVHRSLGRHISHIKSLNKGTWNPTQLTMVRTLNNSGANHIWEHTLLDPSVTKSGRRKPQPKDPVHPTKADFIRAKHQMLSFVYRPLREDFSGNDVDISRQLHSSVRTSNLETSLRLLSQGADPNFFHKDKGCYPLHVAARAGQAFQAELLIVYGADPGAIDSKGNTPAHYASDSNHNDLAEHLQECQYELTDRLAFYLCGRKPDHTLGQHWIIPEMADSLDKSDLAKEARVKLQNLPNHLFEELACDVYDEVDRRETDSIWLSLQNQSALVSDRCTVPFLPVNPDYSSTRNQGRQKLARFNAREFATLIIDVLSDAKRRQTGIASPCGTPKEKAVTSSAEPIADMAQEPTLLTCLSPPPLHLSANPEDDLLPSAALSVPLDVPQSGVSLIPPLPLSPVSTNCSNIGYGGASLLTQNNPLYRSYDEVNGSLEDFARDRYDQDSLDGAVVGDSEGDTDSTSDERQHIESCNDEKPGTHWSPSCEDRNIRAARVNCPPKPIGRKYSSGFSSNSDLSDEDHFADYDEVYDPSTSHFAAQLTKSIKEKLLSPKSKWDDEKQHRPGIVQSSFEASTTSSSAGASKSNGGGSAKSLLVRTLTLPLKYAAQRRQSLTRVFSRSQPNTPILPRRNQVTRSYIRPDQINRAIVNAPLNPCWNRQKDWGRLEKSSPELSNCFDNKRKKLQSKKSSAGKPPKAPSPQKSLARKSSTLIRQASFKYPFPSRVDQNIHSVQHNKPVLEPCATCARNVAANIQHASIWAEVENLPRGYLSSNEEKSHRRRPSRDDCKLQ